MTKGAREREVQIEKPISSITQTHFVIDWGRDSRDYFRINELGWGI